MTPEYPGQLPALSRQQAQQLDAAAVSQLGIPSLLLMENAARGLCDFLLQQNSEGRIVIVCGRGNNGGDGLALYRQLLANGRGAELLLAAESRALSSDAEQNLQFLVRCGLSIAEQSIEQIQRVLASLNAADWIVDAVLGTGLKGAARPPWDALIQSINNSPARVLAVDVPSGMDCDTGTAEGACVQADATVTFVAPKPGFHNPYAMRLTGPVTVCHIGLPAAWCPAGIQAISPDPDAPDPDE